MNNPNNKNAPKRDPRDNFINEEITSLAGIAVSRSVRLIIDGGAPLIVALTEARRRAFDEGLDLVLIDPKNDPPVVKIMDYGKFKFERAKREREAKKKQTVIEIKEIQLTPQIGDGDLATKAANAVRFLTDGNKVKLVIKFRGRQMAHQDLGVAVLEKMKAACAECGAPEKTANLEGRNLILFLAPLKK